MKGLLLLSVVLLVLEWAEDYDREPFPLMIDAAAPVDNRFCDLPAYRAPLKPKPRNPFIQPWGVPNGDRV